MLGLGLFALAMVVAMTAQIPPPLPPGHIPIPAETDASRCFECHVSQGPPPPEEASFCAFCHDFHFAHVRAPRPRHPINFDWPTRDCGFCHRLHSGPNPTHQVSADMPNSSFCVTCHLPPGNVTGEEMAGEFCARCHNLGTPAGHPAAEGKTAEFCYQCHQVEEERATAPGTVRAQATSPAETFPTSLHGTRQGKITWYSKDNGGFETLTEVPMANLPCLKCHASTYADGTPVDPATYQPGCRDCHVTPGDKPKDEVCLGCHSRQGLEAKMFSDVHRDMGFGCTTCHSEHEMHGDGHQYASMLEPGAMDTKCENCHTSLPSNAAHSIHQGKLDCTACHSQSVISCYNCHFESMVQGHTKRFLKPPMKDFELLVKDTDGLVHMANMQSLVYNGKTFVAIAPYTAHAITREARGCSDCHGNAAIKEYNETGKITVTRWDAEQGKLIGPQGVIPVPPDWKEALQFDFLDYTGDPKAAETDPNAWVFLKHGADMMQMLYAEPLTEEQLEKLSKGD